ncbi:MAG: glycerol-3-phosphate dehydrogenase/oxidase [Candidatus Planktophila sp.]|nr:glycerol-3-phosphate dehydrogenase/oxidase [Candidatus Planktophila sp.]
MFLCELNPKQRESAIAVLGSESFDILVIGGGVNGVGAALDAASRGLKVALIESQDIAAGTSSRSSKLIHGGLRYLEQYDFKLVREALHERELLVSTLCPHLVKPVGFLFPLTEKFKERTYVGAGLALYDVLRGFGRTLPWHKHLSQKQINEIAPSLRPDIILGAIKYFDAQVDDARHTLSVARTAARHGAIIATRMSAESLIREGKQIIGVNAKDLVSGKSIAIKATVTVMCAGIWSDALHEKFDLVAGYNVTMSKGVHIVLPGAAINSDAGIILKTPVSVLFIIPWGDKWIVGTTDTPYTGDRAEPFANREDVQYIVDQANRVLTPNIKFDEIIGVYAGLRPLVANKKSSATTKLSREHTVDRPAPGFVSIAGGKYTTYRIMGKDVIDLAAIELRRLIPESVTDRLPLVGADGYFALVQQVDRLAEESGLSAESITHLLNRYGSMISEVLELIKENPALGKKLSPDLPYIRAEIYYAASHEGAQSIDDVISRRTRIAFEAHNHGLYLVEAISEIIAPVLGWSTKERKSSVAAYESLVERELVAMDEILKFNEKVNS